MAHLLKTIAAKNRGGGKTGIFSVCSANELVLRGAMRHAAAHHYPLIIESTSNQVNQAGGYTGMRPGDFAELVKKIAAQEQLQPENLILGGDHLGPLPWQHEAEGPAMEKAADMVRLYTQAGFDKIHLDTSMKLADDPPGPLRPEACARRGALLAKTVYEAFDSMETRSGRPVFIIGSEVPVPGGSKEHEDSVNPTLPEDFLRQLAVFTAEFQKAGIDFDDVTAFVVQPGVEFGDDFVCLYDREKARPLIGALQKAPGLVFEGHSTDYQGQKKLAELVQDGVAILKVGPALTFALREGLFLLEAVEEILVPRARRSGFRKTLLNEMNRSDHYWKKYYTGTPEQIEYKKCYSYSDRCRYYLPVPAVQAAIETLFENLPRIPPALISQFFPNQYRSVIDGSLSSDPQSLLCARIGEVCAEYAAACGWL